MKGFFQAQSIAVVGVSSSALNLGRVIVLNLKEFGYQGCIHLVGPKGGSFLGHKIYPSVMDIPEPLDFAAVLVPASAVPEVLRQCGERGIRRVVVETAGFRELGSDRAPLEEEILNIIECYGIRMIGPNCMGVINRANGLAVPFMPLKPEAPLGRVGVVSQSGGVGVMMINLLAMESIGFSKFASIGNKLDVDETDLLEYFIEDEETELIFCYLEGIADGRKLMSTAGRSGKPIIAHKSNTGGPGAVIARSHSASLSTDDRVVDSAFRQSGIIRIREQRESIELIKALSLPHVKGNRLAVISRSGGHAVMAADAAQEFGFVLPPYPQEFISLVEEHSRARVIQFHNPLDLGDLFNFPLYRTLAEKAIVRDDIDALLFIHNYQGIFDAEESRLLIVGLGGLISEFQKPVAVCVFTTHEELDEARKKAKFPIFTDPREAIRSLALNRDRNRLQPLPFSTERPDGSDELRARSELRDIAPGPIPPARVASLLTAYGIPLVPWERAETEEGALDAALRMGFPVALKTAEPEVIHKSDAGAVCLNLIDETRVRDAYRKVLKIGPSVLVQKMADPGLEWLVGGRQDQHFGPVLVVGLGGIYVEIFKETGLRIGPIGYEEASRLLDECRGSALLEGVRGGTPLDRRSLLDLIVRVSWFLADFPEIRELDLNPVRIFPRGCLALDWRATKGYP